MNKKDRLRHQRQEGQKSSLSTTILGVVAASMALLVIGRIVTSLGEYYRYPLRNAILKGDIEGIRKAIRNGAGVNAINWGLPITLAFTYGTYREEEGAHSDYLRYSKIREIVEVLIDSGADVNMADQGGNVALLVAMTTGYWHYPPEKDTIQEYKKIVKMLVDNGANVNVINSSGDTPLHWALYDARMFDNLDIIELLLQHGAKVNVENSEGETPLDLAKRRRDNKLLQLLLSYESKAQ